MEKRGVRGFEPLPLHKLCNVRTNWVKLTGTRIIIYYQRNSLKWLWNKFILTSKNKKQFQKSSFVLMLHGQWWTLKKYMFQWWFSDKRKNILLNLIKNAINYSNVVLCRGYFPFFYFNYYDGRPLKKNYYDKSRDSIKKYWE